MSVLATIAPRLSPLIRLLASDNNGEVSAAVAGLRRVLATQGLDLHDLADHVEAVAERSAKPAPKPDNESCGDELGQWLALIDRLIGQGAGVLNENDSGFLRNVRLRVALGRPPSEKQEAWLFSIIDKIEARATA